MDTHPLEAVAANTPMLRGIVYQTIGSFAQRHPVATVDDLAQEVALRLVVRARAYPDEHRVPHIGLMAIDAVRKIVGEIRKDKRTPPRPKFVHLDDPDVSVQLAWLPPADEADDDPDEVTMTQRAEWHALSVHERQSRIAEAHRATGTSYSDAMSAA